MRSALETLSRGDEDVAAKALKLGVKNRGELQRNLVLASSGTLPALERYTGVLYDALGADTLEGAARSWADEHVFVQSALFGLVSAADGIPAYRLSASTRLPGLGAPLKRVWNEGHAAIDFPAWGGGSLVLDLRSQDYAALAAVPGAVPLQVAQRGPGGEVRALNHFNKAAKGDLVRRLARSCAEIDSVDQLLAWAADEGLELGDADGLTLITELGAPK